MEAARAPASARDAIVDGVVLAAGRSQRMRHTKALLKVKGESFIEHAVHVLRYGGCRYVVAVVNKLEDWDARLADVAGAGVVLNPAPDSQQIDSLRMGLRELPADSDGALILPVDYPLVHSATVSTLIAEFRKTRAAVVRPTHRGEPGHPVLFARGLFDELCRTDLPEGARTVTEAHAREAVHVEVDDPGILTDIDTPDEYQRHVGDAS